MNTKLFLSLASALLAATSFSSEAANLWIVGDATPNGWDLDKGTSLPSAIGNDALFTGTVYLTAGKDFKFLTQPDWGGLEYGAAAGAALTDGSISLASGSNDEGYGKIQVAEDGNYLLTVDTSALTAKIVKSVYQDTHIDLASLYLVGSATPGDWSVPDGTPLYQDAEAPYEYKAAGITLKPGSFKIATTIKGAGSFNPEYWYFRDADDSDKVALNQEGDLQWQIEEETAYIVEVNLLTSGIKISKDTNSAVSVIDTDNAPIEYFDLSGVKVTDPKAGLYIMRKGAEVKKVIIR